MRQTRKPLLTKRQSLLIWIPLLIAAATVANQTWFKIGFQFGEVSKNLNVTGTGGLPLLNLAIWGGWLGVVGVLISTGRVAVVFASLGTVTTLASAVALLTSNLNQATTPLFMQVSKLSGIAGDHQLGANGVSVSDGWTSYEFDSRFVIAFFALLVALLLVQIAILASALRWPKRLKADRYAKPGTNPKAASASSTTGTVANKDDAISLWDSQR